MLFLRSCVFVFRTTKQWEPQLWSACFGMEGKIEVKQKIDTSPRRLGAELSKKEGRNQ